MLDHSRFAHDGSSLHDHSAQQRDASEREQRACDREAVRNEKVVVAPRADVLKVPAAEQGPWDRRRHKADADDQIHIRLAQVRHEAGGYLGDEVKDETDRAGCHRSTADGESEEAVLGTHQLADLGAEIARMFRALQNRPIVV